MKKIPILIALLFLAACQSDYHYASPEDVHALMIDDPSYKNDPAKLKSELKAVVDFQKKATKQQILDAKSEVNMKPEMVAKVLGENVKRDNHPKLFRLLDNAGSDCHYIVESAKEYWDTKRPFAEDKKNVKRLVDGLQNGSYPSGHTACSKVWAKVLVKLFPKAQQSLIRRADEVAYHRVIVGMHYPEDLKGGNQLAEKILEEFDKSPDFAADFNAARAEAKKVK